MSAIGQKHKNVWWGVIGLVTSMHARAEDQPKTLPAIRVQDAATELSAGRLDLAVEETPRAIQVFGSELISELRPLRIEDVVTYASNVAFQSHSTGRENAFTIRGFDAPILRDGFRVETFGGVSDPELYNLERLEVLKGPDSVLYGEANPGGLINMVSKRPLDHAHAEIGTEVGSFGSISPRADFGGALDANGRLRYRFVGLYRDDEGWREYSTNERRIFLAPSLRWDINDKTRLLLIGELTRDELPADWGTVINSNGEAVAPLDRITGHPDDSMEREQTTLGYDFDYEINSRWTLQNRLRVIDSGYDYSELFFPLGYNETTGIFTRVPAEQRQDNEETIVQLNLNGDFQVGQMRNRLFAGADYRDSYKYNDTLLAFTPSLLNFLDPDYSDRPTPEESLPHFATFNDDDIERKGVYIQDHLAVTDRLILSAGLRYDEITIEPSGDSSQNFLDENALTPQAGIVYGAADNISLYANYSGSFIPNTSVDRDGNVLEPETGEGYEVGMRVRLIDERLGVTTAVFDITKQNVATADPDVPFASVASGEQQSRGFEIDVDGEVAPGWRLLASYGYTDTEITEDNDGLRGSELANVPNHTASLWTTYAFSRGAWNGLTIGAGFQYASDRFALADNSVEVDGYIVFNAALSYRYDRWLVSLNLNNVTDEKYIRGAQYRTDVDVTPGAPFGAVASLSYAF